MSLRQAAHEQVDIVDVAVDGLEVLLQDGITGQLGERMVWLKPKRPPRLVERAEADIPLTLDVDGDEIDFVHVAADQIRQTADCAAPRRCKHRSPEKSPRRWSGGAG